MHDLKIVGGEIVDGAAGVVQDGRELKRPRLGSGGRHGHSDSRPALSAPAHRARTVRPLRAAFLEYAADDRLVFGGAEHARRAAHRVHLLPDLRRRASSPRHREPRGPEGARCEDLGPGACRLHVRRHRRVALDLPPREGAGIEPSADPSRADRVDLLPRSRRQRRRAAGRPLQTKEATAAYFQTEAFRKNPIGVAFDPEALVEAYEAGAPRASCSTCPRVRRPRRRGSPKTARSGPRRRPPRWRSRQRP